ncbi:MAG TPA: glycosyltransferase family A protein [Chryseosolibacter sp.]
MKTHRYSIRHFDLAENAHDFNATQGPQYWIFWYKSIPLGDVYVDAPTPLTAEKFYSVCCSAITPALKFSGGQGSVFGEKHPALDAIQLACSDLLRHRLPESFPERCPMTVVICTRNRPTHLKNCLKRLQMQVTKPEEIIVVDNASDTEETRIVTEQFPGVRYVREDKPGLDIARNRGVIEATHELIAYTDDDTIPNPYWTFRVYETFRDPSVAAMTGLVIAASLETEAEVIFEKFWPFNRGYVSKIYDNNFFSSTLQTGPPVWEIGAGANMAFRKSIFEEVGYFDERLDVGAAGCSGDSEQWYRILANGFKIIYNPLAVVQHSHRNSLKGLKQQLHCYMRGFTVAILIQYQRFGHTGNIRHLLKVFPFYYLTLIGKGFPFYNAQYQTIFAEMSGVVSGVFYYLRHRDAGFKNELGWH